MDNGRKATAALTAIVRAGKGAGAKALAAVRRMVVDDDALILAAQSFAADGPWTKITCCSAISNARARKSTESWTVSGTQPISGHLPASRDFDVC